MSVGGGFARDKLSDRTTLFLLVIEKAVGGMMMMMFRFSRVGSRMIQQLLGIPIGGPLSAAVLHTVLGQSEWFYDKVGWIRLRRQTNMFTL